MGKKVPLGVQSLSLVIHGTQNYAVQDQLQFGYPIAGSKSNRPVRTYTPHLIPWRTIS